MAGGRTSSKPSVIESLLIAQAVWEHGYEWKKVSEILRGHPLVKRSDCSIQWCESTYDDLMAEAGLQKSEGTQKRHAATNHALAEKYYRLRLKELRDLVLAEEVKFKAIVAQIDAIQNNISTVSKPQEEVPKEQPPAKDSQPAEPTPAEVEPAGPTTIPVTKDQATPPQAETSPQNTEGDHNTDADGEEDNAEEQEDAPSEPQIEEQVPSEDNDQDMQEEEQREGSHSSPADIQEEQPPIPPESSPEQLTPESLQPEAEADENVATKESPSGSQHGNTDDSALTSPETGKNDEDVSMDDAEQEQEPASSPVPSTPVAARKHAKRKSLTDAAESPRERKRAREGSETAEDEPGQPRTTKRTKKNTKTPFQHSALRVHDEISQHRSANIFHNPIRTSDAPDYSGIVRRPMDLKTLRNKVKDGAITSMQDYFRDLLLMFANALMYNRPDSDVYKMAHEMMHDSVEKFETHLRIYEAASEKKPNDD